jgi:DsbE subfamily thiol:disulfide oxidoreductase
MVAGCSEEVTSIDTDLPSEVAPDFNLTLLEGGNFKLSNHKGKPVVVNFFASWCAPCSTESPVLNKVYRNYQSQGVVFVGVAVNDTESEALKFIEDNGLTFPAGLDATGEIKDAFGVYGMPTTYFIDADSLISYLHPGIVTDRLMHHEIDRMLTAGAARGI